VEEIGFKALLSLLARELRYRLAITSLCADGSALWLPVLRVHQLSIFQVVLRLLQRLHEQLAQQLVVLPETASLADLAQDLVLALLHHRLGAPGVGGCEFDEAADVLQALVHIGLHDLQVLHAFVEPLQLLPGLLGVRNRSLGPIQPSFGQQLSVVCLQFPLVLGELAQLDLCRQLQQLEVRSRGLLGRVRHCSEQGGSDAGWYYTCAREGKLEMQEIVPLNDSFNPKVVFL